LTIYAITSTVSWSGDQGADPNRLVGIDDELARHDASGFDLPSERVREFARGLGAILLHGLGLKRAAAERIMCDSAQSVL
jgi:hypothetical protein